MAVVSFPFWLMFAVISPVLVLLFFIVGMSFSSAVVTGQAENPPVVRYYPS